MFKECESYKRSDIPQGLIDAFLAMDTNTGTLGNPLAPAYDGLGRDKFNYMDDVDFWEMIDTEAAGMEEPAGLELYDGISS